MIDIVVMIFYQLNNLGFISLEQILSNLILLVLLRGFYLSVYLSHLNKEQFAEIWSIYYVIKQGTVILVGMLYLPLAAFISFYSFQLGGLYIKLDGVEAKNGFKQTFGQFIIVITPLMGIVWFLILGDIVAVAAIGLGLLLFLLHGLKETPATVTAEFLRRLVNKIPVAAHYGVFIIIIVLSSAIALGVVIYAPPAKQTVNIQMRDGINLATDIYLAPGSFGSPRSVILIRTTYGKDGMDSLFGSLYLTQGYHMVVQDVRGTFDSGDHEKSITFQSAYVDGVDTINWILTQRWCNGKIASVGPSALGINEFYYAGMNPEGLLCQSLMVATPDLYKIAMYPGGAFKEYMVTEWLKGVADNYEYQLDQIISHPKKDLYHNSTSLFMVEGPNFQNVNVSAIHIGGWYDVFQQGTLDGFMGYDDDGLEGARGKQLLIMGPFTHGFPGEGKQGELVFPTKSKRAFDLYLNWEQKLFDHVLLGKTFDWEGNRVIYYMMGDINDTDDDVNNYRYAKDWPVPYENDTWFLKAGGMLAKDSPGMEANYSYTYDPRYPVPTLGGTNLMLPSGPYDQRSIENRDDVLIFETPVLTEDVDVVGRMWARLFVMSNCTNTDFTVKITDVYPDGRSMLVTDGIINAIRRDGFDRDAAPLNASGPVEVIIDLWSTAYQFNAGHKIRIAISSSNYPRYAINPNTGAPQQIYSYQYLVKYIANNTILVGDDYPSYIILPRPT
ncbi:MAG: CocE/NonD family hydrolase [Candidatus Odinarchaeota archaeon]